MDQAISLRDCSAEYVYNISLERPTDDLDQTNLLENVTEYLGTCPKIKEEHMIAIGKERAFMDHQIRHKIVKKSKALADRVSAGAPVTSVMVRTGAKIFQFEHIGMSVVRGLRSSVGVGVISAAVFLTQIVFHSYQFFHGDISREQLGKYIICDGVTGVASVTGSIAGAFAGASIGTLICPGIGTIVGGFIGGVIGGIGMDLGFASLSKWIGNKIVNDDKHYKKIEEDKQYNNALSVFGMQNSEVSPESVEKKKSTQFMMFHPSVNRSPDAHNAFLAVCASYYVIRLHKNYL